MCPVRKIRVLQSIPLVFRESYARSKALKSRHFCPSIQFSDEEDCDSDNENENEMDEKSTEYLACIESFKRESHVEQLYTLQSRITTEVKTVHKDVFDTAQSEDQHQLTPGWIASLDETQKIRKIYIPKKEQFTED